MEWKKCGVLLGWGFWFEVFVLSPLSDKEEVSVLLRCVLDCFISEIRFTCWMEGKIKAIQIEHLGRISSMWQWDMQCHSLFEWVKINKVCMSHCLTVWNIFQRSKILSREWKVIWILSKVPWGHFLKLLSNHGAILHTFPMFSCKGSSQFLNNL